MTYGSFKEIQHLVKPGWHAKVNRPDLTITGNPRYINNPNKRADYGNQVIGGSCSVEGNCPSYGGGASTGPTGPAAKGGSPSKKPRFFGGSKKKRLRQFCNNPANANQPACKTKDVPDIEMKTGSSVASSSKLKQ